MEELAKILRKKVKEENIKGKIMVVYNESLPLKKREVNSLITSPGIAGLLITDYIVQKLLFINKESR